MRRSESKPKTLKGVLQIAILGVSFLILLALILDSLLKAVPHG